MTSSYYSVLFVLCVLNIPLLLVYSDPNFSKVKEWLQNLGLGDHATVMQDDEEADDEAVPSRNDESAKNRCFLVKCDFFRSLERVKYADCCCNSYISYRWFFVQRCSIYCCTSNYSASTWKATFNV